MQFRSTSIYRIFYLEKVEDPKLVDDLAANLLGAVSRKSYIGLPHVLATS